MTGGKWIRWQRCSVIFNQPVCCLTSIKALDDNNMHHSSLCGISGSHRAIRDECREDHQCHSSFFAAPKSEQACRGGQYCASTKMSHQFDCRDFLVENWTVLSLLKSSFWAFFIIPFPLNTWLWSKVSVGKYSQYSFGWLTFLLMWGRCYWFLVGRDCIAASSLYLEEVEFKAAEC